MFNNKELRNMIIPLFLEQFLVVLVGIVDTFVVSFVSEAAVSGVSLVNSFNTIFIFLFTALASGGAVVVSQYLGKKDAENASKSISQLLMISTLFSIIIMITVLIGNRWLLHMLFGSVETDVMEACVTYLRISAYSYPALAIYNAGTSMYRSVGKTKVTMYISIAANMINVIGNCIGVFVLKAGVAGVAWPSLIARVFSAVIITILCFQSTYGVQYYWKRIVNWDRKRIKMILAIAVPNAVESGIFQFVKVALSSVVALFGTYQIAANGIAQSLWSMSALVCVTMGPVFITVIGQCMGAGKIQEAEYFFKKLLKITVCFAVLWNLLIVIITPAIMQIYQVSEETRRLTILLVLIHNVFNSFAYPFADPLGKGLRAAGDIKFTTVISIFTTVAIRLLFSALFSLVFQSGVLGITWAMCLDWTVRAIIFWMRFRRGKWKSYQIIK